MPVESLKTRIRTWFKARMPIDGIAAVLAHKTVPQHAHAVWYYLGSMLLMSLVVLIITGALLVVYYQPYVSEDPAIPGAHESVQRIVNELPHGWWIRSIHHWAAHLMIMALIVHFMSTLLLKAYRRPRELIWWSGLVLVALTLGAAFTGYLLPWNDLSFAATRVGAGIVGATPIGGPLLRQLLLGGPDVTGATLTRFFGLHVAVLPLLILGTVAVHVGLVVHHGSSVPPSVQRSVEAGDQLTQVRFWPDFVYREARLSVLLFAALALAAFLFPPALGHRADPLASTPAGIKPEWYFLALFKALKLLPAEAAGLKNIELGVVGSLLVAIVVVLLPVLDAPGETREFRRRRARWRAGLLLLSGLALAWVAAVAPVQVLSRRLGLMGEGAGSASSIPWGPIILAILVSTLALLLYRASLRRSHTPASVFGIVLLLACAAYTLWEAFGAAVAGLGVILLVLVLLGINLPRTKPTAYSRGLGGTLSAGLLVGFLALTIPLGKAHEGRPEESSPPAAIAVANEHAVPAGRRDETIGRFAVLMGVTAFLLWVVDRRVRYQRRLRDLGMTD